MTIENVTGLVETGGVYIRGDILIPRAGSGFLGIGALVSVQWQNGRAIMAYGHEAQKAHFVPSPIPGSLGVVEELFIAGVVNAKDVYFRNDRQVLALRLHDLLGEDPVDLRWGADMRTFVVVTGKPTAADLAAAALHPKGFLRVTLKYHVFEFANASKPRRSGFGTKTPKAKRLRIIEPFASDLVLFRLTTRWEYREQNDGQVTHSSSESFLTDPTGGPGAGQYYSYTTIFGGASWQTLSGPGVQAAEVSRDHTLAEVLNGVNEDERLWFGTVTDFGLDMQARFWCSASCLIYLLKESTTGATVLTGTRTVFKASPSLPDILGVLDDPSTVTEPAIPNNVPTGFAGTGALGEGTYGEAHAFLVLIDDSLVGKQQVKWASTGSVPSLLDQQQQAIAFQELSAHATGHVPAVIGGFLIQTPFDSWSGPGLQALTGPADAPLSSTSFVDAYPTGYVFRRQDLFDEARLPFITEALEMDGPSITTEHSLKGFGAGNGTEVLEVPVSGIHGAPGLLMATFITLGGTDGADGIAYVADRTVKTFVPEPVWTYRIRRMVLLDSGHVTLNRQPRFLLIVDKIRLTAISPSLVFEKQIGAFLMEGTDALDLSGNFLATLLPFQSTNPGPSGVADTFAGTDCTDDGTDLFVLSANRTHILWTLSTKAERDANLPHLKLSALVMDSSGKISSLTTKDVGTDWVEFQPHFFTILNLDADLYEAREPVLAKPGVAAVLGTRFVTGWNFKTKVPTLDQAAKGYPIADTQLKVAGTLKALPTKPLVTPDSIEQGGQVVKGVYHAVNDATILTRAQRYDKQDSPAAKP